MTIDKLEEIGFYTLSNDRAKNVSRMSRLWRCELILTHRCNFRCRYCRGMMPQDKIDMPYEQAKGVVSRWIADGLKNVRFSGGEPTLWAGLAELVTFSKNGGIERIALSTNGSAKTDLYDKLLLAGVNDFSVSLDGCCSSMIDKMSGKKDYFEKIMASIKYLAARSYVTVGIVLTDENSSEVDQTIGFAESLGVSDIRVIPAAQNGQWLSDISKNVNLPILKYRLQNMRNGKRVRGLSYTDTKKCPLVLDDMAVMNGKHYPCIIYLREHGDPIGSFDGDVRMDRYNWFIGHDCFADPICRDNCLDVCVDYNNKVMELNDGLRVYND